MNYDELTQQMMTVGNEGGPDAIIDYINDYVNENPNSYEGYLVRSEIYTEMGDFQEALDDAEKAVRITPKEAVVYDNRGCIYVKSGNDIKKALNDFNKAIELNINYIDAYVNRANVFLKMKDFKKAINDCTKAIELSPNEHTAYYNRGLAYMNVGETRKALDDYNKVIDIKPDIAETYAKRGLINSQSGNTQKAISDYEEFLRLDPDNKNAKLVRDELEKLKGAQTAGTAESYKKPVNKELRRLLICSAIGLIFGALFGGSSASAIRADSGDIIGGMWLGIGAGVGLSNLLGMFGFLYENYGLEDAFKTSALWFVVLMISGPIGFIIQYRKTR